MKKYFLFFTLIVCIVTCLSTLQNIKADPVLNFFFYPYPDVAHIHKTLTKPGKIAQYKSNGFMGHYDGAGIFSTYAGYIDISNFDGQTVFPRKDNNSFIYIIITEHLVPVIMFGNTVHHWELDKNGSAAFFKVEKKKDDLTGLFFWDVQTAPVAADYKIPFESVVIIAKPVNIYVPIGISPADNTPHMLLPPLYVKEGMNIVDNALYMLTITHFFSPSRILYTKEEKSYAMHAQTK